MTTWHRIDLPGLRGHHPLAFLAACGLLRIASSCYYRTGLGWDAEHTGGYCTAFLKIDAADIEMESLRENLVNSVAVCAKDFIKDINEIGINKAEAQISDFRKWSESALEMAYAGDGFGPADLLSCIGVDFCKKNSEKISTTLLAMTSGPQDLISGARKVAQKLAKRSRNNEIPESVRQKIEEAIFGPWTYQDDEHSFGWDPNSQRLHALGNKAPTNDNKNRSVAGAVFLAIQALPIFPCFVVNRRPYTTGFHRDDGEDWFSWPAWQNPISLDTLRSLLAQPFTNDMKRRGVDVVFRCCRVRTGGADAKGDYRIFSHAQQRPWPSS